MVTTLAADISRRRLLAGSATLGALLSLPACGSDEASAPAAPDPSWTFTDARGVNVTQIAPLVALEGYGVPAAQIVAGYERFARLLGADTDTPEVS